MKHARVHRWLVVPLLMTMVGCSSGSGRKTVLPPSRYDTRPPKSVPAFMKGTIFEIADVEERQPYLVSGFGLVVGLDGTADNAGTPMVVRQYMESEMHRHGFGSKNRNLAHLAPGAVLRSGQAAVTEVYGFIPPGARAGQRMDVLVRAIEGSQTSSLARGTLFRANLYINGVDYINPRGKVNVYARAEGPLFVNPVYMTQNATTRPGSTPPSTTANLRYGTIMHGGYIVGDRPLHVRVRAPQLSVARAIELRIAHQFQDPTVARTKDEGIVYAFTPHLYEGDWEHFVGVMTHLYLDMTPGSGTLRARMLAEEAVKPGASLMDISYCWEGLGKDAIPAIQPLYTHRSADVAYAAARAGAFVGDYAAEEALADMSRNDSHPFQLNAVQTLGRLQPSTRIDRVMVQVLTSKNTLARIAAYHTLARHDSPVILSKQVSGFTIDRVLCEGDPLVYATRTGEPRIALFGRSVTLNMPIMFRTLEDRFTISTGTEAESITLFDRTSEASGITVRMRPDVMELIYRLGGGTDDRLRFGYADIVGILQGLSNGRHLAASFVLQDLPGLQDAIEDAPPIIETGAQPAVSSIGK